MPTVGLAESLVWFLSAAMYIVIPIAAIAIALRLLGVRRRPPEARLRERLARGEISQAEYDTAISALHG